MQERKHQPFLGTDTGEFPVPGLQVRLLAGSNCQGVAPLGLASPRALRQGLAAPQHRGSPRALPQGLPPPPSIAAPRGLEADDDEQDEEKEQEEEEEEEGEDTQNEEDAEEEMTQRPERNPGVGAPATFSHHKARAARVQDPFLRRCGEEA